MSDGSFQTSATQRYYQNCVVHEAEELYYSRGLREAVEHIHRHTMPKNNKRPSPPPTHKPHEPHG